MLRRIATLACDGVEHAPTGGGAAWARAVSEEARIAVRLSPRADRNELVGMRDGVLHARVCAPPVDGEANRALCRLIARRAGVAPSRVRVVRGERAREKLVAVEGLEQRALLDALG